MITKRDIKKFSLIGLICASVLITVYVILPSFMDLENEPGTYEGSPTYTCTTAFDISSCNNKTNIEVSIFSNNGINLLDLDYKP